jgi:hypothetical protein
MLNLALLPNINDVVCGRGRSMARDTVRGPAYCIKAQPVTFSFLGFSPCISIAIEGHPESIRQVSRSQYPCC